MASNDPKQLEKIIQNFRIEDLKKLLETFKKRKSGTKPELMARALELINSSPPPPGLGTKVKQIYQKIPVKGWFPTRNSPLFPQFMNSFAATRAPLLGERPSGSSGFMTSPRLLGLMSPLPAADASIPCTVGAVLPVIPSPCSGVKMKELPFHEMLSVIRKPTILDSSKLGEEIIFQLKLPEAREMIKSNNQLNPQVTVLLRFCTFDSKTGTTSEQPDQFPEGLVVKFNGRLLVKLPDRTTLIPDQPVPKRISIPIEIPSLILGIHSTNIIQLLWTPEADKSYCCSLYLTRKLSAGTLLQKLMEKPRQVSEVTKDLIKNLTTESANSELDGNDLYVPMSIRVSLACPISMTRIKYPCRGVSCKHLKCFDALAFLLMNQSMKQPKFTCPICKIQLKVGDLRLDGYFFDILDNLPVEAGNEVELFPDGAWRPVPATVLKKRISDCDGNPVPPSKKMKSIVSLGEDEMNKTIDLDEEEVVDEQMPMPTTSISSIPIPSPYFSLNDYPTKCNAACEAVESKGNGFVDSARNGLGLGLGKENEVYLDLDLD